MPKIRSRTRPDFQDSSASQRNDSPAKIANRFGITHPADEVGIDAVAVDRHDSPAGGRHSNGLKSVWQTLDRYTSSVAVREDSKSSNLGSRIPRLRSAHRSCD